MTYTPGPWTPHAIDRLAIVYVIGPEPQNKFVCHMDDTDLPKGEQWANARLIAQAPELADAVQSLLDIFAPNGSYLNDVQARVVTRAICALAKAHGRTE